MNIEVLYSDHQHRLVLVVDDLERAGRCPPPGCAVRQRSDLRADSAPWRPCSTRGSAFAASRVDAHRRRPISLSGSVKSYSSTGALRATSTRSALALTSGR